MLVYLLVVAVGSVFMSLTGTTPPPPRHKNMSGTGDHDSTTRNDYYPRAPPSSSSSSRLEPSMQRSSSSSIVEETMTGSEGNSATATTTTAAAEVGHHDTTTSSKTYAEALLGDDEDARGTPRSSVPTTAAKVSGSGSGGDGTAPSWSEAVLASVGVVAGEYTCAYDDVHSRGGGGGTSTTTTTASTTSGTLYAGSRGLYFESWAAAHPQRFWLSFLIDTGKTLSLQWEHVSKVIKLDHGIRVQCVAATSDAHPQVQRHVGDDGDDDDGDDDDGAPFHDFQMHLVDLDRVWLLLISLQNDSIMGRETSPIASSGRRLSVDAGPPPGSMRRRNSDPLLSSMVRVLDESMIVDGPAATAAAPPPVAVITENPAGDASTPPAPLPPILPSHVVGGTADAPKRTVTDSFVFSTAGLDMHEVERLAGKLSLQPIPCIHESVKGKLYAGKAAVYFYGRKYFWDKKEVFLKWDMIRQIRMIDAKTAISTTPTNSQSNHNAADDDDTSTAPATIHSNDDSSTVCVGIRIVAKDGRELQFVRVDQADRVWAMLVSLHNENLTSSSRQLRRKSQYRQSLRRMNSDPTILASEGVEVKARQSTDDGDDEGKAMSTTEGSVTATTPASKPRDDDAEWAEIQASASYANVVVKELILNGTTLDEIFKRFLQNDAECSLARFLESRGDSNLRESPWEASAGPAAEGEYTRVVRYTHPVNAPLAPPMANARKEQRYRRYANLGLCVWTKTIVDDVPMTDCFYVADRATFTVLDQGRVSVRMEFEITFVKSTMFKGIISKTTSSEVTAGLLAHAAYMSAILGDKTGVVKASVEVPVTTIPVVAPTPGSERREPATSWQGNAMILLLALVVLFQLWVVRELREVKGVLRLMQQPHDASDGATSGDADGTCRAG